VGKNEGCSQCLWGVDQKISKTPEVNDLQPSQVVQVMNPSIKMAASKEVARKHTKTELKGALERAKSKSPSQEGIGCGKEVDRG